MRKYSRKLLRNKDELNIMKRGFALSTEVWGQKHYKG